MALRAGENVDRATKIAEMNDLSSAALSRTLVRRGFNTLTNTPPMLSSGVGS